MISINIIQELGECFSKSFINTQFEFIVEPKSNTCFRLEDCETKEDVVVKILHWCSRNTFEGHCSKVIEKYLLDGINEFLKTSFTKKDMEIIYQELGNGINEEKTRKFIQSGFNFFVLRVEE